MTEEQKQNPPEYCIKCSSHKCQHITSHTPTPNTNGWEDEFDKDIGGAPLNQFLKLREHPFLWQEIKDFIAQKLQAERERCAEVAEKHECTWANGCLDEEYDGKNATIVNSGDCKLHIAQAILNLKE